MSGADTGALARRLAELADSKGATEVVVLDMRRLVSYTDYLAICTARNERQAKAVVDEVRLRLKNEQGLIPSGTEGEGGGRLDRPRLPRRGAPCLHRGGAPPLPARGSLAGCPPPRGGVRR